MNNKIIKEKVNGYFLRVLKDKGLYVKFKSFYSSQNNRKMRCIELKRHGYLAMVDRLFNDAKHEFDEHGRSHDDYELITFFINYLLRKFLESNGVDPRRLGMIGQEIFDLTCNSLYGDKYKSDMEEMNKRNGGIPTPKNDKEAWLVGQYMALRDHGKINMSFAEFLMKIQNQVNEMSFNEADYRDSGGRFFEPTYEDDDEEGDDFEDIFDDDEDEFFEELRN